MTDQQKSQEANDAPGQGAGGAPSTKINRWHVFLSILVVAISLPVLISAGLYITDCSVTKEGNVVKDCIVNDRAILANLAQGAVAVVGLFVSIFILHSLLARLRFEDEQTNIQTKMLEDQREQTASHIRKEVDERFSSAIELLGNDRGSARTGAIYALYELAVEKEKYRQQIARILCGHIRSQTQNRSYQEAHPDRPSDDVQTAINVLFMDTQEAKGLYAKFSNALPPADLSYSYLVGANFVAAMCQKVNFWRANCQAAYFMESNCQGANFTHAHCQRTGFMAAQCQGASFWDSYCQGANFGHANCQGTFFKDAQCQGALFEDIPDLGANFESANFQGAYAFANIGDIPLSQRIGQPTELETMIVSGKLNDESVASIKGAPEKMPPGWHERMNAIMEEHATLPTKGAAEQPPADMVVGVLEDSRELQEIIKRIEKEN